MYFQMDNVVLFNQSGEFEYTHASKKYVCLPFNFSTTKVSNILVKQMIDIQPGHNLKVENMHAKPYG